MENNGLTKLALQNQPHGKRNTGRPIRRWRGNYHLKVNEYNRTGLTALNLQRSFMIMILISRT
jgi:hypothetical protein